MASKPKTTKRSNAAPKSTKWQRIPTGGPNDAFTATREAMQELALEVASLRGSSASAPVWATETDVHKAITIAVADAGSSSSGGGGGGTQPSGDQVVFTQSSPSDTWTVTHNLSKVPSVLVLVGGEEVITAVSIQESIPYTVTVRFNQPQTGKVYLQ
jgi:hypothetical protein